MVPVLMLLMAALVAADEPMMELSDAVESVDSASVSVVYCDAATVCPDGTTCCLSPYGVWYCCPFSMGQCCRDGVHCCRHGYHCDSTSTHCLRGWMRLSSSPLPASKAIQKTQDLERQTETEIVHCEGNVYCPAEKFCCKTATGQWGCCSGMVL
ncbi:progranulin-like isoform X1 [Ctenopharyngodon idella]|uniref:progranulin-like isoform X1 n=1 Tax=Ctenopharyngodon idella TaxID=7959 RepID=UPI002231F108|nr:progranulin-like isoform X1 [Ctenopharyngodon idella]XP_051728182.1 progranulin-like isoform X2 [Ctenopharyngodon idella]XP_051728183.1 progranulin-like isoform X1 [Ctenopharyngodon idella]